MLALGLALVPLTAAAAAPATSGAAGFGPARAGTAPAAHAARLQAAREAAAQENHAAVTPPATQSGPGAVAAGRAAAASPAGRPAGAVAAGAAAGSTAAPTRLADFPAMSLSQQQSDFGDELATAVPDTQVAAGPTAIAEAAGDTLSVWSKKGNLLDDMDLNAFFAVPSGQSFTDPSLLYDAESGRFFLSGWSVDSAQTNVSTYLAVSNSSNPDGGWTYYVVLSTAADGGLPSGDLTEQPMIGTCSDKVVMTWNDYVPDSSGQEAFDGAGILAFQKSDLLTRADLRNAIFFGTGEFSLVPARSLSPTSTCWVTVNDSDPALLPSGSTATPGTLGVISLTGVPATSPSNVILSEVSLPVTATSAPPAPAQPGGTLAGTGSDDRLISASWQDNQLWASATDACTPDGDTTTRNCMRLFEVSTAGDSPTLGQDEDLGTSGLDEYYPAVSQAADGDTFVSYTASSATQDAGAYVTASPAGSGTAFSAPVTIEAGSGYSSGQWGAFSSAAPDPAQPDRVWAGAEYAPSDANTGDWATGAAEVTLSAGLSPLMAVSALWGSQDRPYAQAPQLGSGWHSLGGTMLGAPAVAAVPNPGGANPVSPVFVAVGTNRKLYLRGVTGSWQLLGGKQPPSCLGSPAAVVTGKTLSVACEGTDHQLYYDAATLPGSGLPVFTAAFKNLGGSLTSTPAIAPAGGTAGQLIFVARGAGSHLYTRTPSTGWVRRSWQCLSAPAAAQQASTRTTYLACEGTNKALYTGTVTTSSLTAPARQPGSITTAPALAATSPSAQVVLRGTGGVITAGPLGGTATPLPGLTAVSVGAAALN